MSRGTRKPTLFICDQLGPRSACAFAWSNRDPYCWFSDLMNVTKDLSERYGFWSCWEDTQTWMVPHWPQMHIDGFHVALLWPSSTKSRNQRMTQHLMRRGTRKPILCVCDHYLPAHPRGLIRSHIVGFNKCKNVKRTVWILFMLKHTNWSESILVPNAKCWFSRCVADLFYHDLA